MMAGRRACDRWTPRQSHQLSPDAAQRFCNCEVGFVGCAVAVEGPPGGEDGAGYCPASDAFSVEAGEVGDLVEAALGDGFEIRVFGEAVWVVEPGVGFELALGDEAVRVDGEPASLDRKST